MVVQKRGEALYKGLKEVVTQHLASEAVKVNGESDGSFLSALNAAWERHTVALGMIRDVFMYMVTNGPKPRCLC